MLGKGTQHQKPNKFYYKSLEKCWGFYKESTYMIFNCTSFHIFNAKFYSIIWHGLRIFTYYNYLIFMSYA